MRSSPTALLVAALVVFPAACVDQGEDGLLAPPDRAATVVTDAGIKLMSQNMYLGANIDLLLTADDPSDVALVFQQLQISTQSGMFKRAQQMALQIATWRPHLVGLQEVTTYQMGGQTLDFLYVLQQYLAYFHSVYDTPLYNEVRHDNTTVLFPASAFGPFPDVTYTDGDAILVRSDVSLVGDPFTKSYDAYETFSVAGTTFQNRRGFLAVTANVEGQQIRFGNTHLEVQLFEDTQLEQTAELIETFADETLPVILVGDFNSAANHDAPADQKTGSYRMLRNAGYSDLWLRDPHSVSGSTCCQSPTLTNVNSELTQRLDLVLVRWGRASFAGQSSMDIVGEESSDRITFSDAQLGSLTLWPSDHAAVTALLWPAPGRLARN